MRIALAQINFHVGNFSFNTAKIIESIEQAKDQSADLIVFSELSVCGYPPKDLLFDPNFLSSCNASVSKIAKECRGISAIVGCPIANKAKVGKPLFNAALLLSEGRIIAEVHKSLIPNYDVFDECRYFEPAEGNKIINVKGFKIGLTICEDIWNQFPDRNGRFIYYGNPIKELALDEPHCIINISASPFSYNHGAAREEICKSVVYTSKSPIFYINTLGCNTDLIFDGGSIVVDKDALMVSRMDYFAEGISYYELFSDRTVKVVDKKRNSGGNTDDSEEALIYKALLMGIRDYFDKSGMKAAILGLSGGIDSALVLALAVEALGAENVFATILPSRYTSVQSLSDANQLVRNIGCKSESISIEAPYESVINGLAKAWANKPADIAEENIQSRIRGLLLMALSNKSGLLMLNTSNKSELATGYGTLYGDMNGALSVIGDLYKTQVYSLARYINSLKPKLIPESIIAKAPSAELKANQKDTDTLPEYEILDKILFQYIEEQKSYNYIQVAGANISLVKRIVEMVNRNEFKRKQFCPILRISPKAFGEGRRMPIVAKYLQ